MLDKVLKTPDRELTPASKVAELADFVSERSTAESTTDSAVEWTSGWNVEKRAGTLKSTKKLYANLEDFELRERLGFGWYGDVFAVKNCRQGNAAYVLKTVRIYASNQWPLRFELAALSELKHENLVEVKRAFVRYGILFVIFPLHVILEDVVDVLQPSTMLPAVLPVRLATTMSMPVLCSLVGQLYRAMIFLHNNDLMHLDVKPANLLLAENGTLKLADLAISQQLASSEMHDFHRMAESQRFVAPEVAANEKFDKRADTWCFALCVIQMAYGVRPFEIADIQLNGTIMPLVFATNEREMPLDVIYRLGYALEQSMPVAMSSFVRSCLVGRANRRPLLRDLRTHEFIRGCVVDRELVVDELLGDVLRAKYRTQRTAVVKRQAQQLAYSLPRTSWVHDFMPERFYPIGDSALIHIVAFEPQSSRRRELQFPVSVKLKIRLLDEELRHHLFQWLDERTFSLHNFYQLTTKVLRLFTEYKQHKEQFVKCVLTLHPDPLNVDMVADRELSELRGHEFVYLIYVLDGRVADEAVEWLTKTERFLVRARYCKAEGVVDRAYRRFLKLLKSVKPRALER